MACRAEPRNMTASSTRRTSTTTAGMQSESTQAQVQQFQRQPRERDQSYHQHQSHSLQHNNTGIQSRLPNQPDSPVDIPPSNSTCSSSSSGSLSQQLSQSQLLASQGTVRAVNVPQESQGGEVIIRQQHIADRTTSSTSSSTTGSSNSLDLNFHNQRIHQVQLNQQSGQVTSGSSSFSRGVKCISGEQYASFTADNDGVCTQRVLQDGLGLVVNERGAPSNMPNSIFNGEINQWNWQSNKHTVKSRLTYLLSTGVLSDVVFMVGGSTMLSSSHNSVSLNQEQFLAHKFVLSMGSAVFDAMFNGPMASKDDEAIAIPDVEPRAFSALLSFLYTDELIIESETVMAVLYAAKKYAVPALEQECVEFLKENISSDNAFLLLSQARLFDEPALARMCLDTIDKNTSEALSSDSFSEVDIDTLCHVLARDSLGIRESKLFSAVTKWAECECLRRSMELTPTNLREVLGKALRLIRYPLMTVEEFAVQVAQSKILNESELVELFMYFTINPKPSVSFDDRPRCCLSGKEQVVSRFCQVDHRWGYSGASDRIKFIVSKKIHVAGFGVYGGVNGPSEFSCTIELQTADTQRVLGSADSVFTCDGTSSAFRVMFDEPVELQACVHYLASVTMKGPDSYYGSKGLRKVTHESPTSGKVTFQFSYAAGNNNGTSVEDGQIPEIYFYT